jgi:LysM repeat protein
VSRQTARLLLPLLLVVLISGCGQVITLPTDTPVFPTTTVVLKPPDVPTLRPTATPAPYTPAPTATATPTPTPIIYAIKRGDTLLGIASQFGVTVSALQDTNGIVDPRALRIDQQLIIPQDEEALLGGGEPTATPTPMPFTIENLHFDQSNFGGLWCYGEVYNGGVVALDHVQVVVSLLDDSGASLAGASAFVQQDLVPPDGRSPFVLQIPDAPAHFASYTALPLSGVPAHLPSYYLDLELRGVETESERYATYTVSGRVVNVGPEDAVGVRVVLTAYDALGQVVGVREGVPEHNVVPRGGETSFQLELLPAGGPVITHTISVLGLRLLPTPTP